MYALDYTIVIGSQTYSRKEIEIDFLADFMHDYRTIAGIVEAIEGNRDGITMALNLKRTALNWREEIELTIVTMEKQGSGLIQVDPHFNFKSWKEEQL